MGDAVGRAGREKPRAQRGRRRTEWRPFAAGAGSSSREEMRVYSSEMAVSSGIIIVVRRTGAGAGSASRSSLPKVPK